MGKIGTPSVFACPDCHGVLWEINEGKITRYRCRVGHAYNIACLSKSMDIAIENALWAALRAIEEKENLAKRIIAKNAAKDPRLEKKLIEKAKGYHKHIVALRTLLKDIPE